MFLVPIVQLAVCLLILSWLLKQKPGERFSKKAVWRSTSLNDLLVCSAAYGFPLCGASASSPSSKYFLTHAETKLWSTPCSFSI